MYQQVRVFNRSILSTQVRSIAHINSKPLNVDVQPQQWTNAKPATEIPGPTKFELIRGFLPGGVFYKKSLFDFSRTAHEIYGELFRLPAISGRESMIMTLNPDDFPIALRSEGVWPYRVGMGTLNYHREVHRKDDFGDVVGLLGSNGEQWNKIRSAVNPVLMQPKNAKLYLNKMLEVNREFLERIREIRDPNTLEMPAKFENEVHCLTLESVAVVALDRQIGLIGKHRNNEEAKKLFDSLRIFLDYVFYLDIQPSLWKYIKTPKFNKSMKAMDTMYDIIIKYVNEAVERIENENKSQNDSEEKSVLEKLLKIDKKVAVVMTLDMLMAGVDTTSSTLIGILLALAKSPEKQQKLRQELLTIMPHKDSELTLDNMKNLPYLRACIKEGIRIYPLFSGSMRRNINDIVLSGYQVSKGENIVVNSNLLLLDEKHFPRPKEFLPERWLRNEKNDLPAVNPFLYTPFSFGPRSCIGKRIVDLELEITVSKLIRNFYMEFNYPAENAFENRLINVPIIPLTFKFSEVEN